MNNLEQIVCQYYRDKNGNPMSYHIRRKHRVSPKDYQIQLDGIIDDYKGIEILDPEGMTRVYNPDEVKKGTYWVRNDGNVFFYDDMACKDVLIDYYSIGLPCIGVGRIYTLLDEDGNVIETLEDILERGKTVVEALKTMNDVIVVIDELKTSCYEGIKVVNRLDEKIDETNKLILKLNSSEYAKKKDIDDLNKKISDNSNSLKTYNEKVDKVFKEYKGNVDKEIEEYKKKIDEDLKDYKKNNIEEMIVCLNDYKKIAKAGTELEDWTLAFDYVFQNVIRDTCATIKWNGQLKIKSTINVPQGVSLIGTGLPYSGLVPTSDFAGDWIIKDSNKHSHNSYKNIYLAFANNPNVKGLNVVNPYDYCQIDKVVGDGNNNTFISIGGRELSQTLHISDCICYAKPTCKGALFVLKNLQEPYIVNNKALFSGVGNTHPMYADGVVNATILNNSFGFTSVAGLKMTCIDYPKRIVGNLIEGNLFENCNDEYALEFIGNNQHEYEGYNNTIRDNCYFGGSDKIYIESISDTFIVDKCNLVRGSSARRTTFIQKYADSSNDAYGNLIIGMDGKKLKVVGDLYADTITGDLYIPNPIKPNIYSYIKRNTKGITGDDEGLEISVDGDLKMKLKNNHIYNWKNGGGVVLWSPNGTGYLTTVTDDGKLETTKL